MSRTPFPVASPSTDRTRRGLMRALAGVVTVLVIIGGTLVGVLALKGDHRDDSDDSQIPSVEVRATEFSKSLCVAEDREPPVDMTAGPPDGPGLSVAHGGWRMVCYSTLGFDLIMYFFNDVRDCIQGPCNPSKCEGGPIDWVRGSDWVAAVPHEKGRRALARAMGEEGEVVVACDSF